MDTNITVTPTSSGSDFAIREFQTQVEVIKTQCDLMQRDIYTTLNKSSMEGVTADDIKNSSKLTKTKIADYLLSIVKLSDELCQSDYISIYVNQPIYVTNINSEKLDSVTNNISIINENINNLSNMLSKAPNEPMSTSANNDNENILNKLNDLENHINTLTNNNTDLIDEVKVMVNEVKNKSDVLLSPGSNHTSYPVEPNTVSPHSHPIKSVCEPYVKYINDAITGDLKDKLIAFVEEHDTADKFKSIGDCRDCIYYGEYGYQYTGGKHEPCRTPEIIQDLLQSVRPNLSNPSAWINSCLITRYKSGKDHIPPHGDDELFFDPDSEIATVSIGAERTMSFSCNSSDIKKELRLDDCSALITSRFAQDFWKHSIKPDESITGIRYSFTFRHIAPHFINSTVIVGDSNTKHLQFGSSRGTFGKWMPGKRLEALHIEEIPDPEEIGPYRNIVIHTGVNNIKSQSRKSNKTLVNELELKCNNIHEIYPKARLYISMLLPTKLGSLNYRVNELNSLFLDMAYKNKNIRIIDNSTLGGRSGCLREEFGRWNVQDNCPNSIDIIHLGKSGIRKFGYKIKTSIIKMKNDRSDHVNSKVAVQGRHQDRSRA